MIVSGAQLALIALTQPLIIPCRWRGIEAQLMLHAQCGIVLSPRCSVPTLPGMVNAQQPFFSYPFERVRSTADDGRFILWINFGPDGEQVRDICQLYATHYIVRRELKLDLTAITQNFLNSDSIHC